MSNLNSILSEYEKKLKDAGNIEDKKVRVNYLFDLSWEMKNDNRIFWAIGPIPDEDEVKKASDLYKGIRHNMYAIEREIMGISDRKLNLEDPEYRQAVTNAMLNAAFEVENNPFTNIMGEVYQRKYGTLTSEDLNMRITI